MDVNISTCIHCKKRIHYAESRLLPEGGGVCLKCALLQTATSRVRSVRTTLSRTGKKNISAKSARSGYSPGLSEPLRIRISFQGFRRLNPTEEYEQKL